MLTSILNGLAFGLGTQELLIILAIVLIFFGGAKIPALMRGVGRGMGELQEGLKEGKKNFEEGIKVKDEEEEAKTGTNG